MSEISTQIFLEIQNTSILEWLAFLLSILYLIFATKEIIWCWLFAIISSAIYLVIFFKVNLYIDSVLQIFYVVMAVIGWYNWGKNNQLQITFWKLKYHLFALSFSTIFSIIVGLLLDKFTDQAFPFVDSFVFCFSILGTYMITKKIIENWIYFIVIDFIAIFIYWQRNLHLTSILFILYVILAIFGFYSWKKQLKNQK